MSAIPEGMEPAHVSAAKDIVQDELDTAQVAGDIHDEADIVGLADRIITRLVKAGVTIPEDIEQPLMVGFHKVAAVEERIIVVDANRAGQRILECDHPECHEPGYPKGTQGFRWCITHAGAVNA